MKTRLINYFRAGYPALAIQTCEEKRAVKDILEAAKEAGRKDVLIWDGIKGLRSIWRNTEIADTEDPIAALGKIRESKTELQVIILCDLQVYPLEQDPILNQSVKAVIASCQISGSVIIFLGSSFRPPTTFARDVVVMDYNLPSPADISVILDASVESVRTSSDKYKKLKLDNGDKDRLVKAASGMSTSECENAFLLSFIETGRFNTDVVYREKVQAVKRSGLLELIDPDPLGMAAVGGLDNLKAYVNQRRRAFTKEANEYGLPSPRGFMIVGLPGGGKSLSAKAVGSVLGIPTLRLDMGAMFGSLVGESERRMRETLELTEALAPVVLFVDECEKALAGAKGGGDNDSGVTRRVFGTLLTWMQDRRAPVFVVFTANQVTSLPPELLRAGRLDAIFFVDLPSIEDRMEIYRIHLSKRGRDPSKYDIQRLAEATTEYVGSEIEESVIAGMYLAFDAGREVTTEDIIKAADAIVPLAVTMREDVDAIRQWVRNRARPASAIKKVEDVKIGSRKLSKFN